MEVNIFDNLPVLIPMSDKCFEAISKGLHLPLEFGVVFNYESIDSETHMGCVCVGHWNGTNSMSIGRDFMSLIGSKIRCPRIG